MDACEEYDIPPFHAMVLFDYPIPPGDDELTIVKGLEGQLKMLTGATVFKLIYNRRGRIINQVLVYFKVKANHIAFKLKLVDNCITIGEAEYVVRDVLELNKEAIDAVQIEQKHVVCICFWCTAATRIILFRARS